MRIMKRFPQQEPQRLNQPRSENSNSRSAQHYLHKINEGGFAQRTGSPEQHGMRPCLNLASRESI